MARGKTPEFTASFPDLVKLIRSIQRIDGEPDCFGRGAPCGGKACKWRCYCRSDLEAAPRAMRDSGNLGASTAKSPARGQ